MLSPVKFEEQQKMKSRVSNKLGAIQAFIRADRGFKGKDVSSKTSSQNKDSNDQYRLKSIIFKVWSETEVLQIF